MATEFGKRGAKAAAGASGGGAARTSGGGLFGDFTLPPIEPIQLLQGAGFVVLGVFIGAMVIDTVFVPAPEFYKVVVKQPRLFDELPGGGTREIFYTPKPRPTS